MSSGEPFMHEDFVHTHTSDPDDILRLHFSSRLNPQSDSHKSKDMLSQGVHPFTNDISETTQISSEKVRLGALTLATPVMLAPMAGVTNPPFRQLCREQGEAGLKAAGQHSLITRAHNSASTSHPLAPAGLWMCEMITTRALVERNSETMNMIEPDPGDPIRSIQLYGVQPKVTAEAVRILVEENRADHIDLNFGCPAPKVTRKGGGSALPWKLDLFREIVSHAVAASEKASASRKFIVPITAKIRIGIDDEHETFLEAAHIAQEEGIVGLTLHGRTMAQHYSGYAHWDRIGELQAAVDIPVFGNGDIFSVRDAQAMMTYTGARGVAIGRGCQGRPWIFADLAAAMHGSQVRALPTLSQVCEEIIRHGELSYAHFHGDEHRAMRELRKHIGWYLRGFAVGGQLRNELARVSTREELRELLSRLDLTQSYPHAALGARGRAGGEKRPHLPNGWLESRYLQEADRQMIAHAEINISGG